MSNSSVISVSQLDFSYGRNKIFDDFSLTLSSPGIYGLFGRNGSGKSTLLKILSGLLFPRKGTVDVLGFNPSSRLPSLLENIYIVPEEFHLPNITLEVLQETQASFYPKFSIDDFQRYVDTFEIPQGKKFGAMSLGQKKKAVIAFALATHTQILLMDEPTNGLDILGRSQFKAIISGAEHANRIVVISTHQAHDLETLMNHVLFVDTGKIALSADMETLQFSLEMGVADQKDPDCIYQEALGNQWAFVAANTRSEPSQVHLELLYKALSLNKQGVLQAVALYQNAGRTVS